MYTAKPKLSCIIFIIVVSIIETCISILFMSAGIVFTYILKFLVHSEVLINVFQFVPKTLSSFYQLYTSEMVTMETSYIIKSINPSDVTSHVTL